MNKHNYIISAFLAGMLITSCESRSRQNLREKNSTQYTRANKARKSKVVVKMTLENGVYTIPVKVNGIGMTFIFDTGASSVSISETEASFLYKQGSLTEEDIKGTQRFSDANGDISEGTVINLHEVSLGGRLLENIEATVVNNQVAPLLLGQSVLERFGKFTVDYSRKEIVFE